MSKDDSGSNVKDAAEIATELVKAVPIYQDLLQPAAKEVGTALGTIAKTVHIALAPISGMVWSYEIIQDYISKKVSEKLQNVPSEDIETPTISVAGPALEALRFAGNQEELREMYANLLANALDKKTKNEVHPSFVEIIKQITPHEANLLKYLSELETFPLICDYLDEQRVSISPPDSFIQMDTEADIKTNQVKNIFLVLTKDFKEKIELESTLDNLRRLQIVDIDTNTSQRFTRDLTFGMINDDGQTPNLEILYSESLHFTSYGINFVEMCVKNKT